jgi:hypothetical protein
MANLQLLDGILQVADETLMILGSRFGQLLVELLDDCIEALPRVDIVARQGPRGDGGVAAAQAAPWPADPEA